MNTEEYLAQRNRMDARTYKTLLAIQCVTMAFIVIVIIGNWQEDRRLDALGKATSEQPAQPQSPQE